MPDFPFPIPAGCPQPPTWPPPPDWWQIIVIALSNGKDSRAVLHDGLTRYPRGRMLCLYNFLSDEHPGSLTEAKILCEAVGVPLLFTWKRPIGGSLVSEYGPEVPADIAHTDLVAALALGRGQWSDRSNPLCTSTGKRDPSNLALRRDDLVAAMMWRDRATPLCTDRGKAQPSDKVLRAADCLEMSIGGAIPSGASRILLLSGERAEESASRAHKPVWEIRQGATAPTKGRLVLWNRPVYDWTEAQVWACLRQNDSPALPDSYRRGFGRHSCVHCVHKGFAEQCLAFVEAPGPAALRVVVEERIGHKVRLDYFLCRSCGGYEVRSVRRVLTCAGCCRPASDSYQGWRAVWQFVYGEWRELPERWPQPRAEAVAALDRWRAAGRLFRLEDFWPDCP